MARGTVNGNAGAPVRRGLGGVVRHSMAPVTVVGQTFIDIVLMAPGTGGRCMRTDECEARRVVVEMLSP